jgi:hypothetical protein
MDADQQRALTDKHYSTCDFTLLPSPDYVVCAGCGEPWPCLGYLAVQEIERLQARVAELEAERGEPTTEWGVHWTDGAGERYEPSRDEQHARRIVRAAARSPELYPGRAVVVCCDVRRGPWRPGE